MAARWTDSDDAGRRIGDTGDGTSVADDVKGAGSKWWTSELGRETLDQIVRAIRSVVYGQVVIIVQDGKVVQIDRTEKVRLR